METIKEKYNSNIWVFDVYLSQLQSCEKVELRKEHDFKNSENVPSLWKSPGANAGFGKTNIVINQINGVNLDGTIRSYCDAMGTRKTGDPASVGVTYNDGRTQTLNFNLG